MEIISYVSGNTSYKHSKPVFPDFSGIFEPIFKFSGFKLPSFADFYPAVALKKIKRCLWILPAALAVIASAAGAYKLACAYEVKANPLVLQNDAETELDLLDKAMKNFALKIEEDCDENGFVAKEKIVLRIPVTYQKYTVKSGETISGITKKFGLSNISTIIAANSISNVRSLNAGKVLVIPSLDGLKHEVKSGESIESLCSRYKCSMEDILDVNDLSSRTLMVGQELFIPGAKLDSASLKKALGERFGIPLAVKYRMTSGFGYRNDPFTGARQFHNGIDMACAEGTPIMSAMGGTVVAAGWSNIYGKYVIVEHHNGYQTMYGHMSKTLVKRGQAVSQTSRIGLVGNTGYSTGPHLHFTVFKNGTPINPFTVLK